ncbi:MAG: hypothetical protein DI601_00250 [Azospirillum brasilense]|nr:MAG: hypothetical protein DI601_00250 [Azospirillum brasilense]
MAEGSTPLLSGDAAEAVRRPRVRARVGDQVVEGIIDAETTSNGYAAADTFRLSVRLSATSQPSAAWWADAEDELIEISYGFAGPDGSVASWTPLISGVVDTVQQDFSAGRIRAEGRDLTARLIETRLEATYSNRTLSDIAREFAGEHGLTYRGPDTSTLVGSHYRGRDHASTASAFSRQTTQWDLLTWLAGQQGLDVYVEGRDLVVQQQTDPDTSAPVTVRWAPPGTVAAYGVLDALSLTCERDQRLSKDIEVTVVSYDSRAARRFSKTVRGRRGRGRRDARPSSGASTRPAQSSELDALLGDLGTSQAASGVTASTPRAGRARATREPARADAPPSATNGQGESILRHRIVRPGLSEDAALKLAQDTLRELSRHERTIEFKAPGELSLRPRAAVRLIGTASSFDQTYFVDEISRRLSVDEGFTETIRAKNTSPRSTEVQDGDVSELPATAARTRTARAKPPSELAALTRDLAAARPPGPTP